VVRQTRCQSDWFHVDNQNAKAVSLPGYSDHGLSPTGSVLFKPRSNITTYLTYASSLQAGDLAPGTAANAGTVCSLPKQGVRTGVKTTLGKVDLGAALFRIERPFANIDAIDGVFRVSGEQINKGLELSAVGEFSPALTSTVE